MKALSDFHFSGLLPLTLALTFLLREKSAKAYPRGGVLLDISSFVTKLWVIKRGSVTALRERMVLARKANWFCFPSPENRILFDFHGDGASFWFAPPTLTVTSPRGYLRGTPLDTPFVSFLVKGKIPRCGARSSTKGDLQKLWFEAKHKTFLLHQNRIRF